MTRRIQVCSFDPPQPPALPRCAVTNSFPFGILRKLHGYIVLVTVQLSSGGIVVKWWINLQSSTLSGTCYEHLRPRAQLRLIDWGTGRRPHGGRYATTNLWP
jgi:hypothetical protein